MNNTPNINNESLGFIDVIHFLNWQQGGNGGHQRVAIGNVYAYSLKQWKDAYDDLCDKHHRHATYAEYIAWMNATCLLPDIKAEDSIQAYQQWIEQRDAEKREADRKAAIIRANRAAYENACDCLYYGYGFNTWFKGGHAGDISEADARIVWDYAFNKMAND